MAVSCNFVLVAKIAHIGDTKPGGIDESVWEKKFNTKGCFKGGYALLMFNIMALTYTTENVPVKINGNVIGNIRPTPGGTTTIGYPLFQSICFHSTNLNDGENLIRIEAPRFPASDKNPEKTPEKNKPVNLYDDFTLTDVVCFFQQSS
ncbi:MAG TPA: hypothetical protein PKY20_06095 [Methanothrix sp.]|jgi:hypothetical protein|nr:hypothetical protein [Methanothrix sp.]HQJ79480.1 hypothetical protein [Methanothrix sp.]